MSDAQTWRDEFPEKVGRLRRPESTKTDTAAPFGGGPANAIWGMIAAADKGDVKTIRKLAERVPGLANANLEYHQPLHFAVRAGHLEAVRALLHIGANTLAESRYHGINQTLDMAESRGFREIYDLLELDRRRKFNYRPEARKVGDALLNRHLPDLLNLLKEDPALITATDETGNQPIHWASMTAQIGAIDPLLNLGADVNARRFDGARPLDLIDGDYRYWHLKDPGRKEGPENTALVAGYLIARGATYDLRTASRFGDLGRVRTLLAADESVATIPPEYTHYNQGSALSAASGQGHEAIAKLLLESGSDPNMAEGIVAPNGSSLYHAVGNNHESIVKLLLEYGADPNAEIESSGNIMGGAKGALRKMLKAYGGRDNTKVEYDRACERGDVQTVRRCLQTNPELTGRDWALGDAAAAGHRTVIQAMMDANPDLWQQSAVHHGDVDTFRWMLEQGMDPNWSDWKGVTPVHRAAGEEQTDCLKLLLEHGGRTDRIDGIEYSTPLGHAARAGHIAVAVILLEAGADPNLSGAVWSRPLAWAQRRDHVAMAELLRNHGGTVST